MRLAISVVEAAYRWTPSESDWLADVVRAAERYDLGGGLVGYTVDLRRTPRVTATAISKRATEDSAEAFAAFTENTPARLARALYAPTEFAGNCAFRVRRLARAAKLTQGAIERKAGQSLPPAWAVVAGDPRSRVAVLALLSRGSIDPDAPFPSRERARQLGMVGAHLGAALRLRNTIEPSADDDATEAVLTPKGKVLHATGAAVDKRQSIAEAVMSMEQARRNKASDTRALELWNALVAGRWSVVDIVERDGKRLLLARKNPVNEVHGILSLTDEERDVTWLASLGHSYKYISYELGMGPSMVVRRLNSALAKLGLSSRRSLLRTFAGAHGSRTLMR
jgi:DNA-binding CsgD family transcriptional regulator